MKTLKAVLIKSRERFAAFAQELSERNIETIVIDLAANDWIENEFTDIDFVIYFPSFEYSSNNPHSISQVVDFVGYINQRYPKVRIFPDPKAIVYYNDKYRQFLFMKGHNVPIPRTIPLVSEARVEEAHKRFGYPMVIKNRYGAGGDYVLKIHNKKELLKYYRLSVYDFWNMPAASEVLRGLFQRVFFYHLIKERKLKYPFFSPPLLAQELVHSDRDVRVVVCGTKVMEAHWRIQADKGQWKVNIDGGGIGEWSDIPQEVLDLSVRVAGMLQVDGWLALDLLQGPDRYLITEFSPVWHHYAFQEKPTFKYNRNYNVGVPLDVGLNLERMIVDSLIESSSERIAASARNG